MTDQVERLKLRSMRDLAFRLGVSQKTLKTVAAHAGGYYRPFTVRRGAKVRQIDNPIGPLRLLQDRIHERLLRPLQLPEYLHGGIPGRSPKTNVSDHLGQTTIVTADVGKCFPSITPSHIFLAWRETLGCTPTISRLLTQLTSFKGRLPQGAPTSTTLANLVLHVAGADVRRACATLGLTHTTFIDDLTFGGARAPEVLNHAVLTMRKAGFRLPHRKIRIMRAGDQKRVTGIVLGPKLTVPKEVKSRVRAALHRLSVAKPGSKDREAAIRSARGLIAHIGHVDRQAGERLKRMLNEIKQP